MTRVTFDGMIYATLTMRKGGRTIDTNVAKVRLSKDDLKHELKLPPQSEILAACIMDTELVLFIKHPQAPDRDARGATPEMTLSDLRVLGVV